MNLTQFKFLIMKKLLKYFSLTMLAFLVGCDCDCMDDQAYGESEITPSEFQSTGSPGSADLIAPASNNSCLLGTSVDAFTSNVLFQWSDSEDTDSFDLTYTNLSTNDTKTKTGIKTNSTTILLFKGVSYAWSVKSIKSNSRVATSGTSKFYLAGPSLVTNVPLGAVLKTPNTSSGKTTLSWTGSDADTGDVLTYSIYVDKIDGKQTPVKTGVSSSSVDLTLDSGSTYYWRVKTTDQNNNSSFSSIATFNL